MIYFCADDLSFYVKLNQDKFKYSIRSMMSKKNIGLPVENALLPPDNILLSLITGKDDEFYYSYLSYLLNYNKAIYAIMDIMMGDYYNGDTVIITDLNSNTAGSVASVIASAIKERYGYNCVYVKEIDDFKDDVFRQTSIPQEYLPLFQLDKERYINEFLDSDDKCNDLIESLDTLEGYDGIY